MKNTNLKDVYPKRIGNITQYKKTKVNGIECDVKNVNSNNRTFTAEERNGTLHEELEIDGFCFYEFV